MFSQTLWPRLRCRSFASHVDIAGRRASGPFQVTGESPIITCPLRMTVGSGVFLFLRSSTITIGCPLAMYTTCSPGTTRCSRLA
ncbi:uncharacterized protein EI90DRAFT_2453466 [Cantharellus anzutake]|uniref:uncharacterized protein n=1 Tax=Cantharellus anzutake TaxID=1750568 RepID=UPI001905B669|nr:uncharacterized protein EI90DRAFT_2453466 [Cantharellus anzutake]KAF8339066.1 hypothetical protein EI90DRAFT_2453466 [Cantharellus anzutake]